MIPQNFIDDVLDKVNIVTVIGQCIQLNKKGQNHWACCPFHHEKTPSFSVNENKQFYYCFGCSQSGNVISFLMAYKRQNFLETLEELAQSIGLSLPEGGQKQESKTPYYEILEQAALGYQRELKKAPHAIQYLKDRGLTGAIAKRYLIGYAPDEWDFVSKQLSKASSTAALHLGLLIEHQSGRRYDRFRNRITFPVRNAKGRVVAFGARVLEQTEPKYLNSPESSVFHKKETVYGLYEALSINPQLSELVVVEGYMDVISLAQFGYSQAVACMGTAISAQHIQLLKRYSKQVIFCLDGDNAGKQAAYRILETLLPIIDADLNCKFIFLDEKEDPDSFIREKGLTAFQELLNSALSFEDTLIRYLSEHYPNTTVQERSRLIEKARALLEKMTLPSMKALIIDKLSLLCQMPSEQLNALLNQSPQKPEPKQTMPLPKNLWQKAIAYLLHAPKLAHLINDTHWLKISKRAEAHHLLKLISIAQALAIANTQQLLEQIKNEKSFKVYLRILNWQPMLSEKQIETEFLNCFQQVKCSVNQERVHELLELSRTKGLTHDEKMELSQRIKDQKENKLSTNHSAESI